jgi:hypothetical protein
MRRNKISALDHADIPWVERAMDERDRLETEVRVLHRALELMVPRLPIVDAHRQQIVQQAISVARKQLEEESTAS